MAPGKRHGMTSVGFPVASAGLYVFAGSVPYLDFVPMATRRSRWRKRSPRPRARPSEAGRRPRAAGPRLRRLRRRAAPPRRLPAARPPPRRPRARLRQPADRGDRGDHPGRDHGQPQHDVSAAAGARVEGDDRGRVGASRSPHAALLLDHRRRPRRSTSASRRELSPFLDSMIRTVTLIKREIYGEG